MENKCVRLSQVIITISILIPAVIGIFFRNYDTANEPLVQLQWFFISGWYVIIFVIIHYKDLDTLFLRNFLYINLFLTGIIIIYLSLIPKLDTKSAIIQLILSQEFLWLASFNFLVLPLIIMLISIFSKTKRLRKL